MGPHKNANRPILDPVEDLIKAIKTEKHKSVLSCIYNAKGYRVDIKFIDPNAHIINEKTPNIEILEALFLNKRRLRGSILILLIYKLNQKFCIDIFMLLVS